MFKVESLIFVITFSPPLQMLAQPLAAGVGARVAKIVKQRLGHRVKFAQGFSSESVSKMWRPLNLSCDHMIFFCGSFALVSCGAPPARVTVNPSILKMRSFL